MQDNNYRNADTPMSLHVIAQPLVDSMHAEIRMLYWMLKEQVGHSGVRVGMLERMIADHVKRSEGED
tara:strand:+ start:367 stop:567 length:201 start_codon:yes stop_codon:yes gene_type:complete